MLEVRKKQQVPEDARKIHGTNIFVKKVGKMEKARNGRTRHGEKCGQAVRGSDLVQ